ncbi:MAG: hypothetical protein ACP5KB_03305, partial [Thermoprotei archaeon]
EFLYLLIKAGLRDHIVAVINAYSTPGIRDTHIRLKKRFLICVSTYVTIGLGLLSSSLNLSFY